MESGRLAKWIFIAVILLFALFAMYPPRNVVVREDTGYELVAQTPEEAKEHDVKAGDKYWVQEKEVARRWLPLALGQRDYRYEVIGRDAEGHLLKLRKTLVRGRIKLGLDIAGGGELVYRIKPQPGESTHGLLDKVISTLKQRIDPHGVKEFRIQKQGANRILIQIPGATKAEVDQLKHRLTRLGKLEFRLVPPPEDPDPKFKSLYRLGSEGKSVPGYTKMFIRTPREGQSSWYLVKSGEPAITGEYLSRVYPTRDASGMPAVGFEFNAKGGQIFAALTEQNIGWHLAIILDGELKSAPRIKSRIKGSGIIEGNFTQDEVNETVNILRAGSLPVDIELEMESTVGPSLGRDSVRMGLRAIAVGGVLVLVFMAIYYMVCGLVADTALILNLVLLVGALGLLGASLTLPGIAGIMLTVGMAVDANVLVYERIREELASGKKILLAVRAGYDRAFITIVDANVTTLFTALILYAVGTGPVKGFAVTLSAGILLSMFTALYFTRLVFETFIARGWVKQLRMHQLVKNPTVNFTGKRRLCYVGSMLVIVTGLVFFFLRGQRIYDIDFTGGTLADIAMKNAMQVGDVRDKLIAAGYDKPEVQALSSTGTISTSGRATEFAIRVKGLSAVQEQEKIRSDLAAEFKRAELYKESGVRFAPDNKFFEISLAKPIEERQLYDLLFSSKGANYSTTTFTSVLSTQPLPAERLEFTVAETDTARDPVVLSAQTLKSIMSLDPVVLKVKVTKGGIEQTTTSNQTPGGIVRHTIHHLEVKVNREVDPDLFRAWLYQRYKDEHLTVGLKGTGAETGLSMSLSLTAPLSLLEKIQKELADEIELPRGKIDGNDYTVWLAKPLGEREARARLKAAKAPQILNMWPLGVTNADYTITLGPMSEAKRQEKIRQDLLEVFKDNLRSEPITVTFASAASQKDVQKEHVKLTMKMATAVRKDRIHEFLIVAGLNPDNVLAEQLEDKESASEVEIILPKKGLEDTEKKIQAAFAEPRPLRRIVSIGATVANELKGRAVLAIILASFIIVLYVAVRFHAFKFGVAAVIALIHDVCVTVGVVAIADALNIADVKINLSMLAAFLTIIGYSLNDTIVVFDRIRENMAKSKLKDVNAQVLNDSINQTLSRTALTSATTLFVVLVLFLMGGPVLQGLAFALLVGVVVGTYSSIFVASPVLLDWTNVKRIARVFFTVLFFPITVPLMIKRKFKKTGKE